MNLNAMGTARRFDVDSTSILRQYIEDQISTNFHVISTCSFWCNFADWKIHVVFTCFFPRNFDDRNIHVLFTYFFWYNFDGQKIPFVSTHCFRCNFSGQKSTLFARNIFDETSMGKTSASFLVKMKVNENIQGGLTLFVTLKSWLLEDCSPQTFQGKLPGVAQFHWNLSLPTSNFAKKELLRVSFLSIYRWTSLPLSFLCGHIVMKYSCKKVYKPRINHYYK